MANRVFPVPVLLGDGAIPAGRSDVPGGIVPKTQVFGFPAKDKKVAWRELAALSKLPELFKKFKALENRVKNIEK